MGKPSFTQQSSNPDKKAGKVKKKVVKEAAVPSPDLKNGSPLEGRFLINWFRELCSCWYFYRNCVLWLWSRIFIFNDFIGFSSFFLF